MDKDATKRVRKVNSGKPKKTKKLKFKDKHPKAATGIKIGLVVLMLLIIIGVGILVGTFFGVFGEELKIDEKELVIKFKNSTVYDKDGNELAVLSGGTKRKIISLDEMGDYLPKAFVAIEDERFYTHNGVDLKRTAAATLTFIAHAGNSSFGGSTITQQLVKNITTDDDDSGLSGALRKVKEMSKAIQVEQYLSKDQILELYLNIIFIGGDDVNGVALGSVYYFDKEPKDLSIAESAFLAGINHSPNGYNPFKEDDKKDSRLEKGKKRTKTVLGKMEELGYITADQKKDAIAEVDNGLAFKQGEGASVTVDISYHTSAAINQIKEQIQEQNPDMSKDMVELTLFSSGYKIYTTQDTGIQAKVEEELMKDIYIKERTEKKTGEKVQGMPTMVVVDHKTGQVVACATAVGNEEERTISTKLGYFNWPTEFKKQTGSTMKPISVIVPGLETGTITAATTYYDCETKFAGMDKSMRNDDGYSNTIMTMRNAIAKSKNIINAKALMDIGVDKSMEFVKKMGITNIGNEGVSLALGGLEYGTSQMHMAMAYATIANDGEYISPTFYTKVEDEEGNVVLEPEQTKTRVMSVQNAYIAKSILTQPVLTGTATYCKLPGIETCAKTGTTNGSYDRWLCGFSPYYTAAAWYGYKEVREVTGFGKNPAGQIWENVMKNIHEELPNAEFEKPDGIVNATVCAVSGQVAVPGQCGDTFVEMFVEGTVPEPCPGHMSMPICMESGGIATGICPTEIRSFMTLPERENTNKWTNVGVDPASFNTAPTESCPIHTPIVQGQQAAEQAAQQQQQQQQAGHTCKAKRTVTTPANCQNGTVGTAIYLCEICGREMNKEAIAPTHSFAGGKCSVCGAADPNYKAPTQPTTPTQPTQPTTPTPTPEPKPDPTPTPTPNPEPSTPTTPTTPEGSGSGSGTTPTT